MKATHEALNRRVVPSMRRPLVAADRAYITGPPSQGLFLDSLSHALRVAVIQVVGYRLPLS